MNLRFVACWVVALLSCPHVLAQSSGANAPIAETTPASPKRMEAVFHNIQVLKGVQSTELLPIMNFIRSSLGVRCEYCHVTENGKYRLDVKPQKQRAREMILMTRQLNQASFNGSNVVTCNTCHQGMVTPTAVPEIGSKFVNTMRREPDEPAPAPLPSVSEVSALRSGHAHKCPAAVADYVPGIPRQSGGFRHVRSPSDSPRRNQDRRSRPD